MKILIIGSGGREHALGWKIKQSSLVEKIFFAPGNGGTLKLGTNINIKATDIDKLLSFVVENKIDLTIVGPEDPLSMGIVDLFERNKQRIFGPTMLASQLESSKTWSTQFMKKYAIPQPIAYTFNNYQKASTFFTTHDPSKYVIKASGLAMGKGVILPKSRKEAQDALYHMMVKKEFGDAGNEVVIQEKLIGQEVSLIALSDGKSIKPFVSAQDHKRIFDNDNGPNTGGMGVYAPTPFVTKKILGEIQKSILQPTIDGMRREGIPYRGILFAGLMITKEGPKVLEYNVRFGDPETQSLMMLLKSDLVPLILASINGTLKKKIIQFYKKTAVCVILASEGYPGTYAKGEIIHGLEKKQGKKTQIFHAGTIYKDRKIFTNGGRVLGVSVREASIKNALQKAYNQIGINKIYFNGMHYRSDIGRNILINRHK